MTTMMKRFTWVHLLSALFSVALSPSQALDNGLAQVPPMGWNSWNNIGCGIHEAFILETVQLIQSLGLDQIGYKYLNIDDCWMAPHRNSQGALVADPVKFPRGMKWLGDYLHQHGFLFGIYSSAGTKTCQALPASLGHETIDAQTFASFGVDLLKYDNCYNQNIPSIDRYPVMRDALNATGRPILYSLCQWGAENSWQWAASVGNMWRTTPDIEPHWQSVVSNFWMSQRHFEKSTNGAWLDPDMLHVGNGDLSLEENKSHFALWAMAKAPLLFGNDLSKMTNDIFQIITNPSLIAINQDPHAKQATCILGCNRERSMDGIEQLPRTEHENPLLKDNKKTFLHLRKDSRNTTKRMETPTVESKTDFSLFSTTMGNGTVAAMLINWHNHDVLPSKQLNAVQLLGVTPSAHQSVQVWNAWSQTAVAPKGMSFEELKHVPFPELAPHECVVYLFTIIETTRKSVTAMMPATAMKN